MDEKILNLIRQNSNEGMQLIQKEYSAMIKYIVGGILSTEEDKEECINDVYLKIWQNISTYDSAKSKLSTCITSIARNAAVDRIRKQRINDTLDENLVGACHQKTSFC